MLSSKFFARRILVVRNSCCHPRKGVFRCIATTTTTTSNNTSHEKNNSPFQFSLGATFTLAVASLSIGFLAGRYKPSSSFSQHEKHDTILPNGLPRTCCEKNESSNNDEEVLQQAPVILTQEQFDLPRKLQRIVGVENVLNGSTIDMTNSAYLKGARLGEGSALCIVTPRHLHDVEAAVQAILDADCVIIPQGQNTGLTGGSVPHMRKDTRPVVILSMKYLDSIFPIDDGERVVCFAGVGLASLETFLNEHFPHRESHSILGSTFLNPTTAAGVAFGSGGTQCRKGPAYTERALYLKVVTNKWQEKKVEVVNTLGIDGFEDPVERPSHQQRRRMDSITYKVDKWGQWIKNGYVQDMRYSHDDLPHKASDTNYAAKLCRRDSSSVSRCNADTSGPDLNRSEGKVIILATVHDTFPKPSARKTFWISFDSLETALKFRKDVCLTDPAELPISVEYLDRDAFDVIDRSGRLLGTVIKFVGVSSSIVRKLWNMKLWVEALPFGGAETIVDKFAYVVNPIIPALLPSKIMDVGRERDHHVIMDVGEFGNGNMQRLLDKMQAFAEENGTGKVIVQECPSKSARAFRFVAAPAFRTWCVGEGKQGISVDYALPKNGGATPPLNAEENEAAQPVKRMRYSHFGCNVVHEDLAYEARVDVKKAKHSLKASVEQKCNGKLPAEHGHGTEYTAPKETQERWKKMDPLNVLNPGVGGLSEHYCYREQC